MRNDRMSIINQSIVGLQQLATVLAEDAHRTDSMSRAPQTAKEALLSIRVLLPKLEAARALLIQPAQPIAPTIRCVGCEDG
jgi:hypothetical protein